MAEEQIQEPVSEAPAKKKGFLKIIIILVAALAVAGGAGYYFYGNTLMGKGQKKQSHVEEKREVGPTIALEPFIINVSGNASRYVKISIAVELGNEKMVEHTKKITPVIRDVMLTVLGAKTPETFMDVNGRSAIKKELQDAVGRLYKKGELKGVYITDIIMQ
jgi:flagellar protein FliL